MPTTSNGPSASQPSETSRSNNGVPITVVRTGGIAGVRDTIQIDPDGSWLSQTKSGKSGSGSLTPAQLDQLQALAADPRVAEEAARTPGPPTCADGFNYTITIEAAEIRFLDCERSAEPRVGKAILGVLQGAVPGW